MDRRVLRGWKLVVESEDVPVIRAVNPLIDWVRDDCVASVKTTVVLRQALRCLPLVFQFEDEFFWLRHFRYSITSYVALNGSLELDLERWKTIGQFDVEPASTANASISIREACRSIIRTPRDQVDTARMVELSLADNADSLRDLFDEQPLGLESLQESKESWCATILDDCREAYDQDVGFVWTEPLWVPERFEIRPKHILQLASEQVLWPESAAWFFWRDWYESFLLGKPLDLELQRLVAEIGAKTWEAGPEAVAEEIEKIRSKYELTQRIGELERQLAEAEASRHVMGGNNPPEDIDDVTPVPVAQTVLLEPIEELKEELEAEEPDKSRVEGAIAKLQALLSICGGYIAGKLDVFVTEFAKKLAGPAAAAAAAWIAAQQPQIQAVLEAAVRWLGTL